MNTHAQENDHPIETFEVLVTAEEAYPAFERAFLDVRKSVICGFRVFDLDTRLRSDEARALGETWFDLFEHTLSRGVDITLILTDFDPVVATPLHRDSWKAAERLAAVDEVSGRGSLTFRVSRHPARGGLLPRILFRSKLREMLDAREHDQYTPGLANLSKRDLYQLYPVTHHQKLAVFDRTRLYIGGLDLDERRYDTKRHDRAAAETWADVHAFATGSVASAAARHLETFERVVAGEAAPEVTAPGFLRTLSAKRALPLFQLAPRTVTDEIEAAHYEAIGRSTELIYLETQYFRHRPLAEALARAAREREDLRLVLVLPAAPDVAAFEGSTGKDVRMGEALQADAIDTVQDAFGPRALILSPVQPRATEGKGRDTLAGAPIVYVHSKVSIFDGHTAVLSSANLNGRSMRWDTEAGVHLTDPNHVAHLRARVLSHWFPATALGDAGSDGARLFKVLQAEVERAIRSAPEQRRTFLVPYDPEAPRSFGEHQPIVPNELV